MRFVRFSRQFRHRAKAYVGLFGDNSRPSLARRYRAGPADHLQSEARPCGLGWRSPPHAGNTALVLLASLGCTRFAWSGVPIISLGVVAVLAGVAFVVVERTADEPVLAPGLFAHPVFAVGSVLSFAVGAILLGRISFLPTYLQIVNGASATASGLGLLPLIAGLLLTSMASGLIVSRTGRYKALPILGLGVNTTGPFLMSTMGVDSSTPSIAAYLFVFGFGLGLVMQVLPVALQNVVRSADRAPQPPGSASSDPSAVSLA